MEKENREQLIKLIRQTKAPAWECFIFRRMNSTYLVPAPTITDAWEKLRTRQSCSIENCKKNYRHKGTITKDSKIWKVK